MLACTVSVMPYAHYLTLNTALNSQLSKVLPMPNGEGQRSLERGGGGGGWHKASVLGGGGEAGASQAG